MIKFSIFVCTHIKPITADYAYRSILLQKYNDYEIVILDNSVDHYVKNYIKDLKNNYNITFDNIKIIEIPPQLTKNIGLLKDLAASYCCGEFLVEQDHDDIMDTNLLNNIDTIVDEYPDADFFYTNFTVIKLLNIDKFEYLTYYPFDCKQEPEKINYQIQDLGIYLHVNEFSDRYVSLAVTDIPNMYTYPLRYRIFRNTAFKKVHGYESKYSCDDINLMIKLCIESPYVHINTIGGIYCILDSNTTFDIIKQDYNNYLEPLNIIYDDLRPLWVKNIGNNNIKIPIQHGMEI